MIDSFSIPSDRWIAILDSWTWLALLFRLIVKRRRRWRTSRRWPSRRQRQHQQNVEAARRIFSTLHGWTGDRLLPRMLSYLRKIDAYVFEELIMTALEAQGIQVMRNARYSGDGGSDGRFMLDGGLYLIQAKRYQGSINADHVRTFGDLARKEGARGGLFVHTGSTPPGAYRQLASFKTVTLLSGQELVDLMQARPLRMFAAGRVVKASV